MEKKNILLTLDEGEEEIDYKNTKVFKKKFNKMAPWTVESVIHFPADNRKNHEQALCPSSRKLLKPFRPFVCGVCAGTECYGQPHWKYKCPSVFYMLPEFDGFLIATR